MPHIAWPMRFVLPYNPALRFADSSTLGRILRIAAPFLGGRRPAWLTRLGLFVYDHLGGRKLLPATRVLNLGQHEAGAVLKPAFRKAFEYSDCWVEDSRLVALNARDAASRGATILTRTTCEGAERRGDQWLVSLRKEDALAEVKARAIVNAGGPWVADVLTGKLRQNSSEGVRLVRGSHIVTKRLFDHDQPYFLQQPDGRIIFAIPYETDFTLIGTTDEDHDADPANPHVLTRRTGLPDQRREPLFRKGRSAPGTSSGPIPASAPSTTTAPQPPRRRRATMFSASLTPPLARRSCPVLAARSRPIAGCRKRWWTASPLQSKRPRPGGRRGAPLPGGDFPHDGAEDLVVSLRNQFPFLDDRWARRLVRAYGVDAARMLDGAAKAADLGQRFGWNLTAREVDWLITHEFARTAEDILWRRSKLGLRLSAKEVEALRGYVAQKV